MLKKIYLILFASVATNTLAMLESSSISAKASLTGAGYAMLMNQNAPLPLKISVSTIVAVGAYFTDNKDIAFPSFLIGASLAGATILYNRFDRRARRINVDGRSYHIV